MFRVLLVDDEPSVCQGMQYLIDWNSYGFQVVGTAANGKQALQFQQEQPCDLIVTDLKMPVMDGISLIQTLAEQGSRCKVIIVSAYGEFSYAQAAMRYGVQYYLLKPVDEDVLCGYLSKIAEDLTAGRKSEPVSEEIAPVSDLQQFNHQYNLSVNGVVTEIQRYISGHYQEPLSLNSLSQIYNFSPVYMGRLFKKEIGVAFNEYLNNYRIEAAKTLIDSGSHMIYEIAEMVGYKDLNYFYKCFKNITGLTPKEYRKAKGQGESSC